MTTGKTIALTRRTFVGKVMSLLFNMLSRLVITFLPRSKHLLISWLLSPSAVILEPPKINKFFLIMYPDMLVTQLCLILCNTVALISPGSSVHGILQARILERVAIPSPGDLSNPGIEPVCPALQADYLPFEPPGKPHKFLRLSSNFNHSSSFGWNVSSPARHSLTSQWKSIPSLTIAHFSHTISHTL